MDGSGLTTDRTKRRQDAVNWVDEEEMTQVREKKRKLEEAEPYNGAGAVRQARETGKAKAKKSGLSDISKLSNDTPSRLLSESGDSSSEFASVRDERKDKENVEGGTEVDKETVNAGDVVEETQLVTAPSATQTSEATSNKKPKKPRGLVRKTTLYGGISTPTEDTTKTTKDTDKAAKDSSKTTKGTLKSKGEAKPWKRVVVDADGVERKVSKRSVRRARIAKQKQEAATATATVAGASQVLPEIQA